MIVEDGKSIRDTLQDAGINATAQRVAIYRYLKTHLTHPTVDEVFLALRTDMPTLSKTTVYNTLKLFYEKGLVYQLTIDDVEVRYDAETVYHGHFLCRRCGRIYNVTLPPHDAMKEDLNGFDITDCEVNFRGICRNCRDTDDE